MEHPLSGIKPELLVEYEADTLVFHPRHHLLDVLDTEGADDRESTDGFFQCSENPTDREMNQGLSTVHWGVAATCIRPENEQISDSDVPMDLSTKRGELQATSIKVEANTSEDEVNSHKNEEPKSEQEGLPFDETQSADQDLSNAPFPVALFRNPSTLAEHQLEEDSDKDSNNPDRTRNDEVSCIVGLEMRSSIAITENRMQKREKPFKCSVCDHRFANRGHLMGHAITHTGEKPHKCHICGYESAHKRNLIGHMRTHTGEKPYKCSQCDYKSAHHNNLVKHIRTHTGDKPYKCEQCDYESAHKDCLVEHVRTHTGDKPFRCTQCAYRSANKGNLFQHLKTHSGEKPHKCPQCDYMSSRHCHLVRHMRKHTGDKPYECSLCDYKTAYQNHLARHMKKHTGEKPYLCSICDYRSAYQNHLVRHMKTHLEKSMDMFPV